MEIPRVEGAPHGMPSPAFQRALAQILPVAGDALDLGTGTGRIALQVAPHARQVWGLDVDPSMVEAAEFAARRAGASNVRFVQQDAELGGWTTLDAEGFDLITARLFLSRRTLEHVLGALRPGGHFLTLALEQGHWQEAGGSRFNLPAEDVVGALRAGGLEIVEACVEVALTAVADASAAKELLQERRLWTRWKSDGRWQRWRSTLRPGGHLTESHLVVWARRPSLGL